MEGKERDCHRIAPVKVSVYRVAKFLYSMSCYNMPIYRQKSLTGRKKVKGMKVDANIQL